MRIPVRRWGSIRPRSAVRDCAAAREVTVDDREAIIEAARELAIRQLEQEQGEAVEVSAATVDRRAARILRAIATQLDGGQSG